MANYTYTKDEHPGHFFMVQGSYVQRDNILRDEVILWCKEHLGSNGSHKFGADFDNDWVINAHNDVWVMKDDHALEFRLRWC